MEGFIKLTASEVDANTTRIATDCELRHVSLENKAQLISSFMEALQIDPTEMLTHVLAIKLGVLKQTDNPSEDSTDPNTKEEQ